MFSNVEPTSREHRPSLKNHEKPLFFLCFSWFFAHRKHCAQAEKHRKIVPRAFCKELLVKIPHETRSGPCRPHFWRVLGASRASLGHLLGALGRLLAALGRPLGASWPLLGRSWVPSGWSWASLGRILALRGSPDLVSRCFLARLGWVWDPFWGRFEHACCEQSLYLRTALIAAENPSARSPAIIFSPSGAAVCAQHIRRLPKGEPSVPDPGAFSL